MELLHGGAIHESTRTRRTPTHRVPTGILSTRLAVRDDEGATMVEYGLMVALIAVIVAVGATALGVNIAALFTGLEF